MKSIFLSNQRSRRHRQVQPDQQAEQEPFFSKPGMNNLQRKPTPFFQPKYETAEGAKGVRVSKTGDPYEREADTVADAVVNRQSGQQPVVQRYPITPLNGTTGLQRLATPDEEKMPGTNDARMEEDKAIQEKPELQRQDMPKEEEKPVQTMGEPGKEEEKPVQTMEEHGREEEEPVQAKAQTASRPAPVNLSGKLSRKEGKGTPLSKNVRAEMEHSFGADFSRVNIHTDSEAVQMNRELHAQAFTRGQDVYFNSGKFAPESTEGKRLLAHELTHVVQQGGGDVQNKMVRTKSEISIQKVSPAISVQLSPSTARQQCEADWNSGSFETQKRRFEGSNRI